MKPATPATLPPRHPAASAGAWSWRGEMLFQPGSDPCNQGVHDIVSAIDRLIEMDEKESAKQHERAEFLSLTAAVIEALPDALIVTDVQGKIVLFNEKAEFMFGYHRSELIGQLVEKLMPRNVRELHARHRDMYNRFDVSPHARTMGLGLQLTGYRSDGHEFPADITLARMVVPNGVYNLSLIRYSLPPAVPAIKTPPAADRETIESNAGH